MTVKPMDDPQSGAGWATEDESDWRQYLVVLASWWREIAAITVATALLAGLAVVAFNWLSGPKYKAWADVAIVRTMSELNFDQRFTTTSDTDIGYVASNATARRNALIGLAQGPAIAEQVVGQLGDVLNAEQHIPANLARDVKAVLVSGSGRPDDSDLIRITVTADTPERAARIGTAWAEAYVRRVNQLYGQAPDELLASIEDEQARAKASYEKAQTALEEFIAGNRFDELDRQITEKQGVIDQIVKARGARFERWLQVTGALDQARALRTQVAAAGPASTGGGALVAELLKVQALTQVLDRPPAVAPRATPRPESTPSTFTGAVTGAVQVQIDSTPLQIQLDANSELSQNELLADVDALVKALEQRRAELELQITAPGEQLVNADESAYLGRSARGDNASAQETNLPGRSETGSNGVSASSMPTATVGLGLLDSRVHGLEEEVRGLRAQREAADARDKQLTQERDLAWDTLKTVSNKVAELSLARAAGGSVVRLAAPAVPPWEPEDGLGKIKAIILGGLLGLIIGVLIALVASSLGIPPFFSKRQVKA